MTGPGISGSVIESAGDVRSKSTAIQHGPHDNISNSNMANVRGKGQPNRIFSLRQSVVPSGGPSAQVIAPLAVKPLHYLQTNPLLNPDRDTNYADTKDADLFEACDVAANALLVDPRQTEIGPIYKLVLAK